MEKKFEELLQELNDIVNELEQGDLDLDESIKKYQRGMELSSLCQKQLNEAKAVVVKEMKKNELLEDE